MQFRWFICVPMIWIKGLEAPKVPKKQTRAIIMREAQKNAKLPRPPPPPYMVFFFPDRYHHIWFAAQKDKEKERKRGMCLLCVVCNSVACIMHDLFVQKAHEGESALSFHFMSFHSINQNYFWDNSASVRMFSFVYIYTFKFKYIYIYYYCQFGQKSQ